VSVVLSKDEPLPGVTVETLEPEGGGELYYRTCYRGVCRYSSDRWQADMYAAQMVGG
jgi:hypothetical protein